MLNSNPVILVSVAFLSGIFLTLVFGKIAKVIKSRDRQSEIDFLQFERDHRELLRDSRIHRERLFRRSMFAALLCSAVVLIFTLVLLIGKFSGAEEVGIFSAKTSISLLILAWAVYLVYLLMLWRRYKNINNYQKMLYQLEKRIIKTRQKLEQAEKR
ncbi:MAG: hypothetical protein HKN88_03005 [Gammaproteobacteria bacterium]|nr:hypothetical protein [Gammaproteobacteria bacterium]NNC97022.1 hypothetical protein [Gammaproteobacteria bacterium]NNM13872.1 hypothetical protein [Gammaproteobacteria bacterium]